MLKFLNISNFAVIEKLEVEFYQGLNLLTGETGSGKSIIVDALGLLLGARSSAAQIRTGERMAYVEGIFELAGGADERVRELLSEAGIEKAEDRELSVRRELLVNGRNRILIEEQSANVSLLRSLQPFLAEIHGQGEQRALLSTQSHMDLLDLYGGCLSLRGRVCEAYQRWKSVRRALQQLSRELAERNLAEDFLLYQIREIEMVRPQIGEDEELSTERRLLLHAERVAQLGSAAYTELYESDESVLVRLALIRRQLEELSQIDKHLAPALEMFLSCTVSLSEIAESLRGYAAGVEFSPARLAEIEDRLALLEKLKRKYDCDLPGIQRVLEGLLEKLNNLNNLSEREKGLQAELSRVRAEYLEAARLLSACRQEQAPELAQRVMEDLRHVALEQAQFVVKIETAQADADRSSRAEETVDDEAEAAAETVSGQFFTPFGADRVEFYLSANPGETPRPLSQTASGGELSRLMLTLRTVGTRAVETKGETSETVVFDEIDTGIGGRVAEAVGKRLKAFSAQRQVFCVTHQPQIARFADHHYVVAKTTRQGRTITSVKELTEEERVGELARMIGGDEEAAVTRETARWLLKSEKGARGSGQGKAKKLSRSPE
ncbi:MAG TPA: DNA repair protein RecN [Pyrinomonadaceae bacterium]|jgi:DNA repair protein RecN (Recombination protein N)